MGSAKNYPKMLPFSDKDLQVCNSFRKKASLSIIDFKRLEAEAREFCNNDKLHDGLNLYGDLLRYIEEGRVEATDDSLEKCQSQICFRMGLIYEALGRYENAIIYFRKSLQLFKECRETSAYHGNERERRQFTIHIIQTLIKIGELFMALGEWRAAERVLCAARKEVSLQTSPSSRGGRISQLENRIIQDLNTISGTKYSEVLSPEHERNTFYSVGLSDEELEDAVLCFIHEKADKEVTLWLSPLFHMSNVINRVIDLFSKDLYMCLDETVFGEDTKEWI